MYKRLVALLILPLIILFNAIIESGHLPSEWKIATVTPIFKKGASSKVSNYRPISLTSTCCKIFELVVKKQLLSFLHVNKIITPAQHGFLQGHSTCTNLLESVNDWSTGLDKSLGTLILYVDFAKAFDCVSVPKLIFKLQLIGITGNLLNVLSSFLSERSQRVRVGTALSEIKSVLSGVPQGSVLGPILFLLFINDLESSLPPCSVSKFFNNDAKSYIRVLNDSSVVEFNVLISCMEKWSHRWQLPLAVDKCSWMFLSNRNNSIINNDLHFSMSGVALSETCEIRDLGVIFDSKLNFSSHIDAVLAKAKQRLYLLTKSFSSCNEHALVLAFKIYIIPLLEYCSPVWSPSSVTDILRIEAIQRSFTKKLKFCNTLTYSERLLKCSLCSLESRRLIADLVLFYKIINNLIEINLGDAIKPLISVTRGHSKRFKIPPARINTKLHFFTNRTIKVWNCLSEITVTADSVSCFKRSLYFENLSRFLVNGF
ncbi:MAG TPA: reverse transcriptase family protein [Nitrososphaeraceae archaeon]|nr:reverse transcriptase family protein [Nitrososphaeraceae archaeon]